MDMIHYLDQLQELVNQGKAKKVEVNELIDLMRSEVANLNTNKEVTLPLHNNTSITFINPVVSEIEVEQHYSNQTVFTITLFADSWRNKQ